MVSAPSASQRDRWTRRRLRLNSSTASKHWSSSYRRVVHTFDALVVALAAAVAELAGVKSPGSDVVGGLTPPYLFVSAAIAALWIGALVGLRTCDRRIVGTGNMEYQRVVSISWRLFTAVGLASFLIQMQTGRLYLALMFTLGTVLIVGNRWVCRKWLHRRRIRGRCMWRVIVVGIPSKAARLTRNFSENPLEGYTVVGVCTPFGSDHNDETVAGVPVMGDFSTISETARVYDADLVAVSGADAITADAVQQLGWDLEGSGVDLSVTLSLVDVAGPRFLIRPAAKLPMVFVDEPEFSGVKYWLKSITDWLAAALLLLALSPIFLVVAMLVKVTSAGPVIYKQSRVGRNGETFQVLKFRSMYQDADSRLDEIFGGDVAMFYKQADDPRVTRIGRTLRRYSLDELPQLLNVLRGDMSLVGPRPQIDREVAQYDRRAHRRLLVKPGMTGLWQVSGRSSLSVEDSVRLDVFYVENWTIFGDFLILMRTLRAVKQGQGAY